MQRLRLIQRAAPADRLAERLTDSSQAVVLHLLKTLLRRLDSIDTRLDEIQLTMELVQHTVDMQYRGLHDKMNNSVQEVHKACAKIADRIPPSDPLERHRGLWAAALAIVFVSATVKPSRRVINLTVRRIPIWLLLLLQLLGSSSQLAARMGLALDDYASRSGIKIAACVDAKRLRTCLVGGRACLYVATALLPWKVILALQGKTRETQP